MDEVIKESLRMEARLRKLQGALSNAQPGPEALESLKQELGLDADRLTADPDRLYATPEEAIKAATESGAAEQAAIDAINDFIMGG